MFASKSLAVKARFLSAHFCDSSGHTESAGVVASDRECTAFRLWIDGLPTSGTAALIQLREYGFVYDLDGLEVQLTQALATGPTGPLTRMVAQRLLNLLAANPEAVCLLLEEA